MIKIYSVADLHNIPDGTTYLDISKLNINKIPSDLPDSIIQLYCMQNLITEINWDLLPSKLQVLFCNNNNISIVSGKIPSTLTKFVISDNLLNKLPDLTNANSLQYIDVEYNVITSIDNFIPNTVYYLNCSHNKIEFINSYNELTQLNCSHNFINSLQNLSRKLQYLDCIDNEITILTDLPDDLQYLKCAWNKIHTLDIAYCFHLRLLSCDNNHLSNKFMEIIYSDQLYFTQKIQSLIDNNLIPVNNYVLK
jgi:Leucine-rich repeat (LRR) protein